MIFVTSLLATCFTAQAELIEYNGYQRAGASNIVKGGGLEWLMWDVTIGQSINQALLTHNVSGWQLATNSQMATLFNVFQFGKSDWNDYERIDQFVPSPWSEDELSIQNKFMDLFGINMIGNACEPTPSRPYCSASHDPFTITAAWFGNDANQNGYYNHAVVVDDRTTRYYYGETLYENGGSELRFEGYSRDWFNQWTGVALVRAGMVEPSPVPLASSLSLFALGFIVLGVCRSQALHR